LREQAPERLRRLELRLSRFEQELMQAGVDPDDFSPPPAPSARSSLIFASISGFRSSSRTTRLVLDVE